MSTRGCALIEERGTVQLFSGTVSSLDRFGAGVMADEGERFKVIATVPTGLEQSAAEECSETIGSGVASAQRGSISCTLERVEDLRKFDQLRSIDNYQAVVGTLPQFCKDESSVLERLESLPFDGLLDWTAALQLWQFSRDNLIKLSSSSSVSSSSATSSSSSHPNGVKGRKDTTVTNVEENHDTPTSGASDSGNMKEEEVNEEKEGRFGNGNGDQPVREEDGSDKEALHREQGKEEAKEEEEEEEEKTSEEDRERRRGGEENSPLEQGKEEEEEEEEGKMSEEDRERRGGGENSPLTEKELTTFRVTCTRSGRKHSFSSPDAARYFGAGLARYFNWKVKLKDPDIEVLLAISANEARVGVALTRESKFKRNITHFGPTTLRATIAYGMLRCAGIQPGDIVLDPLCGGGSINIEGSLGWPGTYHIAGDIHELAVPRTCANINSLVQELEQRKQSNRLKVDVCRWDVCQLPLRTSCVDVIVTDLPFGKKSGSKLGNWELYPRALREMGRVSRPGTGRAVLLTHDNKAFSKSLQRDVFWKRVKTLWVNVGGLESALYILKRSSRLFA